VIIGVVVFVLLTTLIMGDRMMKSELDKEIETLFADSENISGKVYTSNQIKDLPIPVQRYFRYALKENQPYVSNARFQHGGEFKASKNWVSIKGEEYISVKKPGFVWSVKVPLFLAKDAYIDGTRNLKVKLLSLIKIVDAKGILAAPLHSRCQGARPDLLRPVLWCGGWQVLFDLIGGLGM